MNVIILKSKLDALANAIGIKAKRRVPQTIDELIVTVEEMSPTLQTKAVTPSETAQVITSDSGFDGLDEVDVAAIPSAYVGSGVPEVNSFYVEYDTVGIYSASYPAVIEGDIELYVPIAENTVSASVNTSTGLVTATSVLSEGSHTGYDLYSAGVLPRTETGTLQLSTQGATTITPTTSQQTAVAAGKYTTGAVTVAAMPSGTAGTPTATKGTVSNHSVSVTPSVTNTTGYITGGTKTGTAVSVSASELVSGTYTVDSSGTKDVTNYASASVPSGTEGTPTATKGSVTNHAISVTPSVTNTGGYITGSTKTGTAVTVSASELDSGTKSISANGTGIDVVGYASVDVAVPTGSSHTATLTSNGNSVDCYVRYGDTNYYTNGNTFTFTGGDTLTMRATGRSSTTGIFYVDGNIECEKSGGITLNNYSYELPDYDVSISFTYNSSNGVIYLVRPTLAISANGTYNVDEYAYANVSVSGGGSNLQDKTNISPTTSSQTITADAGYDGLSSVQINAMPSGTAGTPTATKGTVSNHSVSVTPSVTNTTGYITGSTKTGTAVTVSASELDSGTKSITENGTGIDVVGYATVDVAVSGGGSGAKIGTATATPSSASASISFTGLQGEPTSFAIVSAADLATGASPYKSSAVVFDGTSVHGQYITNTSNANMTASDSAFSKSYSNGTLTVTGTGTNWQANLYKLVYSYDGSSSNVGTSDVQVGSGATSITFTNLPDEPTAWSCIFKSNIGTSSGYTRALVIVNDGTSIYGMEMGSAAQAEANWSASYSNGSLTISSQSTTVGGYFHQPGYYQLTYVIGGEISVDIEPLTVTQNGTYSESGKAYSPVVVTVSSGGGANFGTVTMTNSSNQATSIDFTLPSGRTPKAFFARLTSQIARNSNSRYYYVYDMRWDGSSTGGVAGNTFYMYSGTLTNVTSGYDYEQSGTTFTLSTTGSRSASPGSFFNGTYELVYVY